MSENKINSDNLLEIAYSFYTNNSGTLTWESRIINENENIIFSLTDASTLFVNEIEGLQNKLFAYFLNGSVYTSKVYNIPSSTNNLYSTINDININIFPMPFENIITIDIQNQTSKNTDLN